MVSLELLIDASGMARGAAQANSALRSVQDSAATTENRVRGVGASFSNAFQATGGSIQIATGIGQIAKSFGDLNIAAAGFAGSRVLLEFGKVGQDLAQIGGRIGSIGSAFSRLNPFLLIASTAMSAVSLAVSLFSSNAKDAANRTSDLATAMERLNAQSNVARRFGDIDGLGAAEKRRVGALTDYAVKLDLLPTGSPVSTNEFVRETGMSAEEVRRRFLERLPEADRRPFDTAARYSAGGGIASIAPGYLGDIPLRQDSALDIIASYRRDLLANPGTAGAPVSLMRPGYMPEPGLINTRRDDFVTDYTDVQKKQIDEANRAMEELKDSARQVGEYLGDGIADAVLQARSLKDVVAGIANDIARSLIRQSVGNLAAGLAGSFGTTGAQQPTPRTPGVS